MDLVWIGRGGAQVTTCVLSTTKKLNKTTDVCHSKTKSNYGPTHVSTTASKVTIRFWNFHLNTFALSSFSTHLQTRQQQQNMIILNYMFVMTVTRAESDSQMLETDSVWWIVVCSRCKKLSKEKNNKSNDIQNPMEFRFVRLKCLSLMANEAVFSTSNEWRNI